MKKNEQNLLPLVPIIICIPALFITAASHLGLSLLLGQAKIIPYLETAIAALSLAIGIFMTNKDDQNYPLIGDILLGVWPVMRIGYSIAIIKNQLNHEPLIWDIFQKNTAHFVSLILLLILMGRVSLINKKSEKNYSDELKIPHWKIQYFTAIAVISASMAYACIISFNAGLCVAASLAWIFIFFCLYIDYGWQTKLNKSLFQ